MNTLEIIQTALTVIKAGITLYEELAAKGAAELTQNQKNLLLSEFDALRPRIDAAIAGAEPTHQDNISELTKSLEVSQ